jgi:NAD(P)-dependent dehydrogenase (short-subunit alcohol dehydrogenase family)
MQALNNGEAALGPAIIATPMADRAFVRDGAPTARAAGLPLRGRFRLPDEVADPVIRLCSRGLSQLTTLPIDGGCPI